METFKKIAKLFKNKNSELYQISVYELIDKARDHFISGKSPAMCFAFCEILEEDYGIYSSEKREEIVKQIDKFNSKWLTNREIPRNKFWWGEDDVQSRIDAFDKLLEYYIHHPKTIYINQ